MNFNEWYESLPSLSLSEEDFLRQAWEECRSNTLNILRQNYKYGCIDKYGNPTDAINVSVIKEIEKL